ncbi:hypothetical protein ACLOJK_002623 [Asimina triloba]
MQAAARRRSAAEATKNGVVAGSVWESRMKIDEGKGGIKVFNGGDRREDKGSIVSSGLRVYRRLKRNQSDTTSEGRRKWKSDAEKSPIQLRKTRSEPRHVATPAPEPAAAATDESCRELEVDEEKKKIVVESLSNAPPPAPSAKLAIDSGDNADVDEEDRDYYEEEKMEIEKEKFDIKEMNSKEENLPEGVGEGEKTLLQIYEKQPECVNVKEDPPPVAERPAFDPHLSKPPSNGIPDYFDLGIRETQNRVQNIVDLVMWRDISRSALVFGLGTFTLLSSSFTKDMNFRSLDFCNFLHGSSLSRLNLPVQIDYLQESDEKYMVVGEEEAIWVLRMILPYFNALLFKIRGLFSGDPAMTMKGTLLNEMITWRVQLAILLFVLARCGSSITIWTMGRLAFFAVFTVPKLCSAYSGHLARYGEFWIRRFQDAWDSCTHKKAVAAAIFTVIWNLSSVVARVWAVFMLVVAVRYYQQSLLIREEWIEEEAHEDTNGGGQGLTQRDVPTCDGAKEKKGS